MECVLTGSSYPSDAKVKAIESKLELCCSRDVPVLNFLVTTLSLLALNGFRDFIYESEN
jgi:hypothetical protein